MRSLVTGGAGYVGSHIVRELLRRRFPTVVLDDLSLGHSESIPGVELIQGDIGDHALVRKTIQEHRIDLVIHMAARSLVGESVLQPAAYYEHNIVRGLRLLEGMRQAGCLRLVFSSTAAVYGEPRDVPIGEDHPTRPTNPYGETKLAFESALRWYREAYGLNFISLRYFNAAGADPEAGIGEDHDPETHLIPLVLGAASGARDLVEIFGDDYPTRDGTCIRDYIHVKDLAEAHVLAAEKLRSGSPGGFFNLGTETGSTVREICDLAGEITGRKIPFRMAARRPGDPAVLIASRRKAARELSWFPKSTLREILESAWRWHQLRPDGFRSGKGSRRVRDR